MSLSVGARLADFEIVGHLGSGGMGDVYRARDTRLGREVALKVVREHARGDSVQAGRLRREARLLAALNHPNIASIHGVVEQDGVLCLVLELVEGASLAERLARGPLEMADALRLGASLAAGLEAAHDAGVIHRDIKPANLKLRPDGRLAILDFGVGKTSRALRGGADAATLDGTLEGGFLGTPGYMSPEQARGLDVDRRADAWAFGCVLFECLAGRPAFEGATPSDRLAASLATEPDWGALPDATPPGVVRLLEGCLAKDPALRLRDLRDARLELEAGLGPTSGTGRRAFVPPARIAARRRAGLVVATVALASALAAGAGWIARGRVGPPPARSARTDLALPDGRRPLGRGEGLAMSPDGRRVALVATAPGGGPGPASLLVRSLDAPGWTSVLDQLDVEQVAFSPDGMSLAVMAHGPVIVGSTSRGTPRRLAAASAPCGVAWGAGPWVYYAPTRAEAVWRIAESGGKPEPVTHLRPEDGEMSHRWPRLSLDGRWLTYTVKLGSTETFSQAIVRAWNVEDGSDREVLRGGTSAMVTPTGHLIFAREGRLRGVPVGPDLRVEGPEADLAPVALDETTGAAGFALAADGTLILRDPPSASAGSIELVTRDGSVRPLNGPRRWAMPDVSPDGRLVAVTLYGANDQIHVIEIATGRAWAVTQGGGNRHQPRWMPDSRRIVYHLEAPGRSGYCMTTIDGPSAETVLIEDSPGESSLLAYAVAPDGSALLLPRSGERGDRDIFRVPLDGAPPTPLVQLDGDQGTPSPSPDGRWLAFSTGEIVRIVALDRPGAQPVQASYGLDHPAASLAWSAGGRELCWLTGRDTLEGVDVPSDTSATSLAPPRPLLAVKAGLFDGLAALPDGSGFVIARPGDAAAAPPWLGAWTGFLADLERLAPHPS